MKKFWAAALVSALFALAPFAPALAVTSPQINVTGTEQEQIMQLQQILASLIQQLIVLLQQQTTAPVSTISVPVSAPQPTTTAYLPPIVTVSVSPSIIYSDGKPGTATLSWSSIHADYCTYEKSRFSSTGSITVSVPQTTTFEISCTGPSGLVSSNHATATFRQTVTSNAPVISQIAAKAADNGTIYAGEKAYLYGSGLTGPLTVIFTNAKGGVDAAASYSSDSYAEFSVPTSLTSGTYMFVVKNGAGFQSATYSVSVVNTLFDIPRTTY